MSQDHTKSLTLVGWIKRSGSVLACVETRDHRCWKHTTATQWTVWKSVDPLRLIHPTFL